MGDVTTQPTDAEVVQAEGDPGLTRVPVVIDGPVRTVELPSKSGGLFTLLQVPVAPAVRLLSADPRRKSARVIAFAHDIRLGVTQAQAESAGALWPNGVPLVYGAKGELWAATTSAGPADISVIVENWSDD